MNDPIGLTTSGFYKYSIEIVYFHFGKPITSLSDLKDTDKVKERRLNQCEFRRNFDSTDVLNIRRDNVAQMAKILTEKVIAVNEQVWQDVREVIITDGVKYVPTCSITFTDVESLTPLMTENSSIGKLIKAFRTRIKLHELFDENYIINSGKLEVAIGWAIKEQLLDVIDQMQQEDTYTPPPALSNLLDKMLQDSGLKSV